MSRPTTRVTILGETRHVDLLVPADRPVGGLIPQLLELMGDKPRDEVARKVLSTTDGQLLPESRTLDECGILDGAVLDFVNDVEAPPAPVIYDVADTVVADTDNMPGRWSPDASSLIGGLFATFAISVGAHQLLQPLTTSAPEVSWWVAVTGGLVLGFIGSIVGRILHSTTGAIVLGAGTLIALDGCFIWPVAGPSRGLLCAVVLTLGLLGWAAFSQQPRARLIAAASLAIITTLWSAAIFVFADTVGASVVAGIASVALLGALPQIALNTSGLATLDDRRAGGKAIGRASVTSAIASAHAGLSLSTFIVASSIAIALCGITSEADGLVWSAPLAAVLVGATALRARAFPLIRDRSSLYLAATIGLITLANLLAEEPTSRGAMVGSGLVVVGAALAVGAVARPAAHTEASLRVTGNRLETLCILASIPLAMGFFGIFASLSTTFQS